MRKSITAHFIAIIAFGVINLAANLQDAQRRADKWHAIVLHCANNGSFAIDSDIVACRRM